MTKAHFMQGAVLAALAIGIAGCGGGNMAPSSSNNAASLPADAGFGRFSDIPVPKGADMDAEESLVLGSREAWVGRLVMRTADRSSTMYDFYVRQMPGFGWRPLTYVRADTSVLTFSRGDRVATLQIKPRSLMWGSEIRITMSPQHNDLATDSAAMPSSPRAGGLRPDERIQATPLR
jgi:hypothetical protein